MYKPFNTQEYSPRHMHHDSIERTLRDLRINVTLFSASGMPVFPTLLTVLVHHEQANMSQLIN